jgi:hypothetical protein
MKLKKYFLLVAVFCVWLSDAKAQIAFEDSTTLMNGTGVMAGKVDYLVRLRYAGDKYVSYDTLNITLYNLNYTVYKVLPIPDSHLHGEPYTSLFVKYISETLFDTDSSTIEYLLGVAEGNNTYPPHLHIYDEFGNQLFFKDSAWYDGSNVTGGPFKSQPPILNTSTGTKMFLYRNPGIYYIHPIVYSLPGTLYIPCDCYTSAGVPVIVEQDDDYKNCIVRNYPNPSNQSTTIEYVLPKGIHRAELKIISLEGSYSKSYEITDFFNKVELNSSDIPAGNYMYQIQLPNGKSIAKKMMVIH